MTIHRVLALHCISLISEPQQAYFGTRMAQMRDIFFPEFYEELQNELGSMAHGNLHEQPDPAVAEKLRTRWHLLGPSQPDTSLIPIAVDGGIQQSSFSDGVIVSVARACALICHPNRKSGPEIVKRVKIRAVRVFGGDRTYIPSYVRMIAEHEAARAAAERVLSEGSIPLVLMDGSLYLGRFPYAEREYLSHAQLLAELFDCIASLHTLSRDHSFPLVGLSKDSAVFYLYMSLLRENLIESGADDRVIELLATSTSPISLRERLRRMVTNPSSFSNLQATWPISDTRLIELSTSGTGFSHPLLLAPSIYYRKGDSLPSIYRRVRGLLSTSLSERVLRALEAFFSRPTTGLVYWRPPRSNRAFRLDISAGCLGDETAMRDVKSNVFASDSSDLSILRKVLGILEMWFCNDLEYDIPLHQSDKLARFDSTLYKSHYEPYIRSRMQSLGFVPRSRLRDLRS